MENKLKNKFEKAMNGKFECYSTGGGFCTSQFTYEADGYYNVYTIENEYPNDLVYWRIPTSEEDMYACLGQEEYMVMEWDMDKDEASSVEKLIHKCLKEELCAL